MGSQLDKCGAVSKKYFRSRSASLTSLYLDLVNLAREIFRIRSH